MTETPDPTTAQPALTSRPEPEYIARATLRLAQVLAGRPPLDAALAAGTALAILSDVHPPYPPHPPRMQPVDVVEGMRDALERLADAPADADLSDLARVAQAGRELRLYLQHTQPSDGEVTP